MQHIFLFNMYDDTASQETMVEVVRQWAGSKEEIFHAWLYGSRIRGDHHPDSDWDVAVEFDLGSSEKNRYAWFGVIDTWNRELGEIADCNVHVELYNPPETPSVQNGVTKDGVLVYSRIR